MSYAPSEAAIEAAIERRIASPGFFQRVAEQIARGIYFDLAANLVPFGRRSDDKTVRGWPDAYLTKANGTLIAIEATTAVDARTNHWPADLGKLKARLALERRGGLLWVAWCDPSTPTDAAEMREEASRLGLPSDDIHIVFRKDICARLREPFHARFWVNDLDLKVTSGPFDRIKDVIARVNLRQSIGIFPTDREYEEDRVYVPPLLAKVEESLAEHRAALVVGYGATGKTTLAMVLSHRPGFRHAPAYYLDLTATAADSTLVERAGEAITAVADRAVLFVVDNAHLNPDTAVRVFEHWKSFGRKSKLLILTRRIRSIPNTWDDEPEVESIPVPRLDLVIGPTDLEGVYRRLHKAQKGTDAPPVQSGDLARWSRLFGGDLLAFGAAVLGFFGRYGEGTALTIADARAFVRSSYLFNPDIVSEQSTLLDLAAVAEIEVLVPVDAFADGALKNCIRRGVVWVETRGINGIYKLYRLTHPGLGTLLRESADLAATSRDDRCRVLRAYSYVCGAAATRLRKNGEVTEARALVEALWHETEWPLAGLSIAHWTGTLRIVWDLGVLTHEDTLKRSREWIARANSRRMLVQAAFAAPLTHLVRALILAKERLPEVYETLCEEIVASENRTALVERARTTRIGGVASFLIYARREFPKLEKTLREALLSEENRAALLEQILGSSLGGLHLFLTYARTEMATAAKALRAALSKEEYHVAMVGAALVTPLGDLASFLDYSRREMPAVAKVIQDALMNEENQASLVRLALSAPLSQLASFLSYSQREMPSVVTKIQISLLSERLLPTLADRFVQDGPEQITALCKQSDAFTQVLLSIDREAWSNQSDTFEPNQPDWFRGFASLCYRFDRDDLLGVSARAIVRTARREDFAAPGMTILHLTSILTSPHECTRQEVDEFFARCLVSKFLAVQYQSQAAKLSALAGSLRRVVMDERDWIRAHFRQPELVKRVRAETPTKDSSARHLAEWLQLFCAARLVDCHARCHSSMGSLNLPAALHVIPLGPVDQGIQAIQSTLWAGLREWCHVSGDRPAVNAALAETILGQFRQADPVDRPRLAALNAVMIDWLERCQIQNWRLVVDQDCLLDAWERQLLLQETSRRSGAIH